MNRVFSIRSVHAYRKSMSFYDFKPLNCCANYFDKVGRYHQLSTLQKIKAILEPRISRNKTEVKIKAKPYEELLKVLEARERNLEDKCQSKEDANEIDSQKSTILNYYGSEISTSEKHPSKPSEKTIIDSIANDGIFAVKPSLKSKKNADSYAKDKESEKTKAKKTKKAKDKFSARQEYIKRATKHSYALRALKSYIEVNINANEVSNYYAKFI
ncbi:hypothetical protein AVEN_256241-1 [Araneus ventricosus]|uniref:Uncharacterized protein n=1 Tax=Araneus ventricosus TaxID=182803 RepID=A0A4Y2INA2_ARAVE|nr:hypothetical protein AVEN_256241-1 [Araneus ventricosus]